MSMTRIKMLCIRFPSSVLYIIQKSQERRHQSLTKIVKLFKKNLGSFLIMNLRGIITRARDLFGIHNVPNENPTTI